MLRYRIFVMYGFLFISAWLFVIGTILLVSTVRDIIVGSSRPHLWLSTLFCLVFIGISLAIGIVARIVLKRTRQALKASQE